MGEATLLSVSKYFTLFEVRVFGGCGDVNIVRGNSVRREMKVEMKMEMEVEMGTEAEVIRFDGWEEARKEVMWHVATCC